MTAIDDPAPRPTVDFDHHSAEYARTWVDQFRRLRAECPIAWSDSHEGGFWVVSRYDDVAAVARDDITFSSQHDLGDGVAPAGYGGITIPGPATRAVPIELDPPEFIEYRRLMNPSFSPATISRWRPYVEQVTAACVDRCIETGEIDFVLDLANPVPGIFTLAFLGLDIEAWESYAMPMHDAVAYPPGTAGNDAALHGVFNIVVMLMDALQERWDEPRDDLLSAFAHAHVLGERVTLDRATEMAFLIIAGGVDTTTALVGNALAWLGAHPVERQRLVDDPGLRPIAIEEFLRYFSPTQNLARTVTTPTEVAGQAMCPGERVLLSWASANRDPTVFEDPDALQIDRFPNRHAAFGLGAHRCLGSNFSRMEIAVMLDAVLDRLPDYELAPGGEPYESIGTVNGWVRLPATFTPGPKVGSDLHIPFTTGAH